MNKREALYALSGFVLSSCVSQPYSVPTGYVDYDYSRREEQPAPSLEKVIATNTCEQKLESKKEHSLTPEYRALLDAIAWAEGTDCHYNMMAGRMLFTNFTAHPIETGEMPKTGTPFTVRWRKVYTTAAGRYQFLHRTYLTLKNEAGLFQTGFNPEEQDKAAKYLVEKQGITQETLDEAMKTKNFTEIWNSLSWIWASLPCDESKKLRRDRRTCYKGRGRYGQFAHPHEDVEKIFFMFYEKYKRE